MSEVPVKFKDYATLRVLVADDKAFIRTIVQGMLLRLKVKNIMQAANGEQALKILRKYNYRIGCIISDWNMDPIGGLELLRAVRSGDIPSLPPETCFIMLTGHAKESVVKAALALDVHAYLVKPVSYEKLLKTLETALDRHIQVKPFGYYKAITGVEVPQAVKAAETHIPPWVTWISKSPRRQQMEERIKQIRKEVSDALEHSKQEQEDDKIEIRNMRRMLIDEIEPGVVLAEDIYGNDRALLVASGTLLSRSLIGRLKDLAAEGGDEVAEVRLWVGDA